MSKLEHLILLIEKQAKWFETESKKHKQLHRRLRQSVFLLTGLSTALAGFALKSDAHHPAFTLATVISTALIGVLTSIEGLRKPAELWIAERNVYYTLMDLRREVEYMTIDDPAKLDPDKYFEKLQMILSASQEKWLTHVKPSTATKA